MVFFRTRCSSSLEGVDKREILRLEVESGDFDGLRLGFMRASLEIFGTCSYFIRSVCR